MCADPRYFLAEQRKTAQIFTAFLRLFLRWFALFCALIYHELGCDFIVDDYQ